MGISLWQRQDECGTCWPYVRRQSWGSGDPEAVCPQLEAAVLERGCLGAMQSLEVLNEVLRV